MLLSINKEKIKEQVAKTPLMYVVSPYNMESISVPIQNETTPVAGTVDNITQELKQYRDRVLSIRQHIIDRGEPPASSPEELERIIDETQEGQ